MKIGILQNEDPNSSKKWELACKKIGVDYDIISLSSSDWLSKIKNDNYDFFLTRPPGMLEHFKTLYDERLYIIAKVLNKKIYPSFEECYIYENKRVLSYFLDARNIPHPKTWIFYFKNEAERFTQNTKFPIVAKTAIGASGSGVKIIKSESEALKYIKKAFSSQGIRRRVGPNRITGTPVKWLKKAIKNPLFLRKKIIEYFNIYKYTQKDFVIFQEYIPHNFEWRVAKIGESYFGHKKVKIGDKASGSKGIIYDPPPTELLNFVKGMCDENNFNFMAVDIFETSKNTYLVNELQTIFGHVQDHILEVNGEPGRFIYNNEEWVFEKGNFNANESYDLRLLSVINLHKKNI